MINSRPSKRVSQPSSHTSASRSRWLVGSSSSSSSAGLIRVRASCRRMRQPPEKVLTGASSWSALKPRPSSRAWALARASKALASCSAACASAICKPSACASACTSRARALSRVWSPSSTKSVAGWSVSGSCCETSDRRQPGGMPRSPASACRRPASSANRLDLPAPLAPIRPTRSAGCRVQLAPSSTALLPRRSVMLRRVIMARPAIARASAAARRPRSSPWPARPAPGRGKPPRNGRVRGRFPAPARPPR